MKKHFVNMFSILLIISLLVGCTSTASNSTEENNKTTEAVENTPPAAAPEAKSKRTFTFLNAENQSWPYNKEWLVYKLIEEETGVTLDVSVPSGELSDALNLTVASGNMPDLMYMNSKALSDKFGQQGALANILDYVPEHMPNFEKWMKQYPQETQNSMSADGKMYMFPNEGIGIANRMFWMYRKDIFEENQLQEPKTWDELYTVLKKLKEIYPDSYPLTFRGGLGKLLNFAPAFETGHDVYYDFDTKQWRYGPIEDNYNKMITFLQQFLKEGLIPPDFLSLDTKQWQDMVSTDHAFITLDYVGRIDFFNVPMRKDNPAFNLFFMPPPAGWEGGKQRNAFTQFVSAGQTVASTSKQIDEVMKFMDFFYTEKARDIVSWGKEGETYKVDSNGNKMFIGGFESSTEKNKATGLASFGTYTWFDYGSHISLSSPEQKHAFEEAPKYDPLQQPRPAFTPEETEVISTTGQEISKYRDENVSKFILGTKSLSDWKQYTSELENLGVNKILEIYKTAYERALNAK